jgi:hypothetical protein
VTEPDAGAAPEPAAQEPAASEPAAAAICAWCAAPAAPGATRCAECGAALAQRESIGDLRIPGLTSVDPALEDFDKRPLHLRGPSPSQGVAPALIIGAVAGGPIGLVAIGGVAAVAGAELLGTRVGSGHGAPPLEDVGRPSEVVLQALEQENRATAADTAPSGEALDDGMSIWRDLPAEQDQEA